MSEGTVKKYTRLHRGHSMFMLTVNTNLYLPDAERHPARRALAISFKKMIAEICDDPLILFQVTENGKKKGHDNGVFRDPNIFDDNYTADSTIEAGNKQHRLHAHVVVKISHYSNVNLNIVAINRIANAWRRAVPSSKPTDRCRILAKSYRLEDRYMIDYVRKLPTSLNV